MRHLRKLGSGSGRGARFSVTGGSTFAADTVSTATDPGFRPDNGQINRGFDPKLPTTSGYRKVPTQAEVLAAIMTPCQRSPRSGTISTQRSPPAKPCAPRPRMRRLRLAGRKRPMPGRTRRATVRKRAAGPNRNRQRWAPVQGEATAARGGSGSGGALRRARSAPLARPCRQNSRSGTTRSTACRSWLIRCRSARRSANRSIRR